MLFSSLFFLWVFLPAVIVLNFILLKCFGIRGSNALLLASSLLFYAWGEPVYILLMLVSILFNWLMGLLLGRTESAPARRAVLVIAVVVNLASLGFFKYGGMIARLARDLTGLDIARGRSVALPIGISFYTFQAMSYVIDVYRRDCKSQRNLFRVGLYIALFPQLIAGPILRYRDVAAQIERREFNVPKTAEGVRRFIYGLAKKILIANVLARVVDEIYALDIAQVTGSMAWVAAVMYAFQIYNDFSGYSDMAIGLGKIFGFDFKENFLYPYTSASIREFWQRWHISLGSWFREYVYIPLGGNRRGKRRTYVNLLIVFLLTGLWHGASGSFVLWGLYHGFFIVLERAWLGEKLKAHRVAGWVYAFLVVVFGWVLFRVESARLAMGYVKRLLLPWRYAASAYRLWELLDVHALLALAFAFFAGGFVQHGLAGSRIAVWWKNSVPEYACLIALLLLCFVSLASAAYNPFIYFRF